MSTVVLPEGTPCAPLLLHSLFIVQLSLDNYAFETKCGVQAIKEKMSKNVSAEVSCISYDRYNV